MKNLILLMSLAFLAMSCNSTKGVKADANGWHTIFNGKDLTGWKVATENSSSFVVEEGMLKIVGERSHLFYDGAIANHNFTDFELKLDIMTKPNANSGVYFHTQYQAEGWPSKGYEVQVNNTHTDWRKTSGLYAIDDVKAPPTKDDEWFTMHIIVKGKHIVTKLNGKTMVDFTEPEGGNPSNADRRISSGTIGIQAHDPGSVVYYKNIMIKPM